MADAETARPGVPEGPFPRLPEWHICPQQPLPVLSRPPGISCSHRPRIPWGAPPLGRISIRPLCHSPSPVKPPLSLELSRTSGPGSTGHTRAEPTEHSGAVIPYIPRSRLECPAVLLQRGDPSVTRLRGRVLPMHTQAISPVEAFLSCQPDSRSSGGQATPRPEALCPPGAGSLPSNNKHCREGMGSARRRLGLRRVDSSEEKTEEVRERSVPRSGR